MLAALDFSAYSNDSSAVYPGPMLELLVFNELEFGSLAPASQNRHLKPQAQICLVSLRRIAYGRMIRNSQHHATLLGLGLGGFRNPSFKPREGQEPDPIKCASAAFSCSGTGPAPRNQVFWVYSTLTIVRNPQNSTTEREDSSSLAEASSLWTAQAVGSSAARAYSKGRSPKHRGPRADLTSA